MLSISQPRYNTCKQYCYHSGRTLIMDNTKSKQLNQQAMSEQDHVKSLHYLMVSRRNADGKHINAYVFLTLNDCISVHVLYVVQKLCLLKSGQTCTPSGMHVRLSLDGHVHPQVCMSAKSVADMSARRWIIF